MLPQEPLTTVLPATGFAFDRSCLNCGYNLRGLTEPRCPECGTGFDPAARDWGSPHDGAGIWVAFVPLSLGLMMLAVAAPPLLLIFFPIVAFFSVSALQAAGEVLIASIVMRELNWPRFRAWWEGILIGYGLCSITINLFGWAVLPMPLMDRATGWPKSYVLVFGITVVEAIIVQFFVTRKRFSQWKQPCNDSRLLVGILFSKAAAEVVWLLVPMRIVPFSC